MQKEIGKHIADEEQRVRFLKDNCEKIEEVGYMKAFTSDEITSFKDELADKAIAINEIEITKKSVMEDFKMRLKPLEDSKNQLLKSIKEKAEFVREDCYKFIDYEERMVSFYNSLGDLVSSRPVNSEEMQRSIFSPELKTGTNY